MMAKISIILSRLALGRKTWRIFWVIVFSAAAVVCLTEQFSASLLEKYQPLFLTVIMLGLVLLLFWLYLRRYLIIHPLAGDERFDNYFIVLRPTDNQLLFWRQGDLYCQRLLDEDLRFFSVAKAEFMLKSRTSKLISILGSFNLPFPANWPDGFPWGVRVRINLSAPYHQEEAIRFIVRAWKETGERFSSYEDYVLWSFRCFLASASGYLANGLFSPGEAAVANYFQVVGRLDFFFRLNFKPEVLSNIHSISFDFGQK